MWPGNKVSLLLILVACSSVHSSATILNGSTEGTAAQKTNKTTKATTGNLTVPTTEDGPSTTLVTDTRNLCSTTGKEETEKNNILFYGLLGFCLLGIFVSLVFAIVSFAEPHITVVVNVSSQNVGGSVSGAVLANQKGHLENNKNNQNNGVLGGPDRVEDIPASNESASNCSNICKCLDRILETMSD